tara:strand:- start:29528 stop:29674 length:147 start_codon:yes stop_codon:yes gene_type:complete
MTNDQRYKAFLRWDAMIQRQQARKAGKTLSQIHADKWFDSNFKFIGDN